MAQSKITPSYTGQPPALPGTPYLQSYPSPNLEDRIFVVRKDSRYGGFELPEKGDPYTGPSASKYEGFVFATAKPTDTEGWLDLFYLNERDNQDEYNFEVEYPYVDRDYPRYVRTYVVLREDERANEPQADANDPLHSDLKLVDHKWTRLQDAVLDSLFIGVQRTYERLPSPIITSYSLNQYQQEVTTEAQEDITPVFPTVDELTEDVKIERTGTAKAKRSISTVEEVFPDTRYQVEREDRLLPFKFRVAVPIQTNSNIEAGDATPPILGQNDWSAEQHQTTDYKKFVSRGFRSPSLPLTLIEYKLDNDQRLVTITDTWDNGIQTITPTTDLVEASVTNLGNDESILSLSTVDGPFPHGEFAVGISDPVPQKFRLAFPTLTSVLTSTGIASFQALENDAFVEIEHKEEQQTDFHKRVTRTGRPAISLPVHLTNYKMTEAGQLETVIETYNSGLQTLVGDLGPYTIEAAVEDLGNNTSLKTLGTVPNLFTKAKYSVRKPDTLPERFHVNRPTRTTSRLSTGDAEPPTLDPDQGEISIEEAQETEFVKRTTTEFRLFLPVTLRNYKYTQNKEIETVLETYDNELQTIEGSATTVEASVQNLGDDSSIKTVGTVTDLFTSKKLGIQASDNIPDKFKIQFPSTTSRTLVAETDITPPSLADGDISATVEQVDKFTQRTEVETRAVNGLPTHLRNYKMTKEGQIETFIETYDDGLQVLDDIDALTIEASVENLGGDKSLKSIGNVPDVFGDTISAIEIPDLMPEIFKASLPIYTTEETSEGTITVPSLDNGALEQTQTQLTEFRKRVRTKGRGSVPAQTVIASRYLGADQFGGERLKSSASFSFTEPVVDENFKVVEAKVINLGNGTWLKQTEQLDDGISSWPILTEYDQDPETQSLITTTYQVVDATSVSVPTIENGVITRYKRIDQWRSLKIEETYSLPAAYEEQRFMAQSFPSLWDWTTYVYNTACGPIGPIRQGFSTMVQARLYIYFTTSKQTISGLTLIPQTHHLVHDIVPAVLNDIGVINYFGSCSGPVFLPPSSPDYTTYISSIQNTEQLITGESVLWKAGLYKNSALYVTML